MARKPSLRKSAKKEWDSYNTSYRLLVTPKYRGRRTMSWLGSYLEYSQYQESPEIFHFWVGLSTMASVLNRRVWIDRRSHGVTWYQVYPGQMMVNLVAPPAKAHKNTAISLGRKLMTQAGSKVYKGRMSTEKLLTVLGGSQTTVTQVGGKITSAQQTNAIATLVAPELSVLLAKGTYTESLIEFLTDIYDAEDPFTFMTQKSGEVILRNPCLTCLFGTNPQAFAERIPETAHESGFTGRIVHIYHDGTPEKGICLKCRMIWPIKERQCPDCGLDLKLWYNPLTDLDDSEVNPVQLARIRDLQRELLGGLLKMKQLTGPFTMTKEARVWYNEWDENWRGTYNGQQAGWGTRRADYLLRVGMCLRISQHMDQMLDRDSLRAADIALSNAEVNFPKVFALVGQSTNTRHKERVLNAIRMKGGNVSLSELVRATYTYFKDHNEFVATAGQLEQAGLIQRYFKQPNNVEFWRIL